MHRYAAGVFALLCCTALFVGGIAVADGHYDISIAGSVDTPDRQVMLEGQEYTVSAIGVVAPGKSISVSVDAPADATYDLYLYNDNRRVEERINDASSSETFDGDYSAGSYVVAVESDGQFKTVHPVVVKSYDVGLGTPDTARSGDTVEFSVDVANVPGTPENLDSVQVVVSKDGEDQTLTATEMSDGTYVAETTLSETGTYLVYANVRGSEEVNGQKEVLGASGSEEVDVRDPTSTPSPTPTPTETSASGGGGSTVDDTPTQTPTSTSSQSSTATSPTATVTQTPTTSATPTVTTTETTTATATETATQTASPTPNNVVTPNGESPTQTTGSLSALVAVVAVLGFGLLTRRRR